ncbi:MAG: VWA domain-containing protein [Deltaproteobacteria bacterium]|nr:VWA domain-containing protein [Deltaproteobacteria bacterium]
MLGIWSGCDQTADGDEGVDSSTADAIIDDDVDGEAPKDEDSGGVDARDASAPSVADGGSVADGSSVTADPRKMSAAGGTPGGSDMGGSGGMGPSSADSGSLAGSSSGADIGSESGVSTIPVIDGSSNGGANVKPGTLTAGAWDDNRNFDRFFEYRSSLLQGGLVGVMPTSDGDHADAHELFTTTPDPRTTLDVALVIDTTGSMLDEIAYLQAEFLALSRAIEEAYPNSEQRWSLVVYRDRGDVYVVRSYDFETSATAFRTRLDEQQADGGGDYEEASDEALAEMNRMAWRADDDVARLAFWVADAPHHREKAKALAEAVLAARDLGVHIYPVASSGVDELTELTMRSAAQLTGGRYLFLTNDSGVGGEHKEPTIPCYFVTKLDDAILRMVDIEMTGVYREPSEEEIIRKAGDPQDGACRLESGEEVEIF